MKFALPALLFAAVGVAMPAAAQCRDAYPRSGFESAGPASGWQAGRRVLALCE